MPVDLAKIFNEPFFGCVPTTIGELCLFSITWGSQKELRKDLCKPINEYDALDFVRKFVRYICFPKHSLKEGKYKPDNLLLTEGDILSLTDEELEKIAQLYVENNEYLFKKLLSKTKEDTQGQTVHYSEYVEVEYPKNEDESYTQYLLRLSIKEEEKQKKETEKMLKSMTATKIFSNGLEDSIRKTLTWGDSLRKTMESIRPLQESTISAVEPRFPEVDLLDIGRMKEERRLRPFNELADRLDQLIDSSAQAAEFMIKANEIQTRIAAEIKSSGDETTKFSKKNIILTLVVILITAFGIAVSAYNISQSIKDGHIKRLEARESINLLIGNLEKINSSIIANEALKIENDCLKGHLEKQEKMIVEMKILIDNQGNKLREFEKNNNKRPKELNRPYNSKQILKVAFMHFFSKGHR